MDFKKHFPILSNNPENKSAPKLEKGSWVPESIENFIDKIKGLPKKEAMFILTALALGQGVEAQTADKIDESKHKITVVDGEKTIQLDNYTYKFRDGKIKIKGNGKEVVNTIENNKKTNSQENVSDANSNFKPIPYEPSEAQLKIPGQFKKIDGKWYTRVPVSTSHDNLNTKNSNPKANNSLETVNIDGKIFKHVGKAPNGNPGPGYRVIGSQLYQQI